MAKGKVFDAKMEPKRYPKQPTWSPRRENEPRHLQRLPSGTGSKKYRKRGSKGWAHSRLLGLICGSKSIQIPKIPSNNSFKSLPRKNIKKYFNTMPKGCQNSWTVHGFCERLPLGNFWFCQGITPHFYDWGSQHPWTNWKKHPQNMSQKELQTA